MTRRWRTSSSGSWVIGVPFGSRKLHQAFGSNKLQWSQIHDFIGFDYIQRRYTKSRDYSATNKMTRWSDPRCEKAKTLRKGDVLTVARKCGEKRRTNAHDRDYPSKVCTRYLKVLFCVVLCILSGCSCYLYRIMRSEKQGNVDGTSSTVVSWRIIHNGLPIGVTLYRDIPLQYQFWNAINSNASLMARDRVLHPSEVQVNCNSVNYALMFLSTHRHFNVYIF